MSNDLYTSTAVKNILRGSVILVACKSFPILSTLQHCPYLGLEGNMLDLSASNIDALKTEIPLEDLSPTS